MVAVFEKVGVGQWFRYVTGLLEVIGAIGLLLPRYSFFAAILLAMVMIGAVVSHLTVLGGSPLAPIVLLVLTGTIAYLLRPGPDRTPHQRVELSIFSSKDEPENRH